MKTVFKIALATIGIVNGAGYDYKSLGDDWPDIKLPKKSGTNLCGIGKNQSPINLNSRGNKDFKRGIGRNEKFLYKMYDG